MLLRIFLSSLIFILSSCSYTPERALKLNNNQIAIDISPGGAEGVYSVVSLKNGQWVIDKFSMKPINRTNKNQEILFINKGFNYLSPAFYYVRPGLFTKYIDYESNKKGKYYLCTNGLLFGALASSVAPKSNTYDPCKSSITQNTGQSPGALIMATVSLGTLVIIEKIPNTTLIRKIIQNTNLISRAKKFCKENSVNCNQSSSPRIKSAYANMEINYDPDPLRHSVQQEKDEPVSASEAAAISSACQYAASLTRAQYELQGQSFSVNRYYRRCMSEEGSKLRIGRRKVLIR